jgi:hypothetical protein
MALAKGPADFAQIRERLPGISNRMLAQRLQELTFLIPLAVLFLWAEDHLPASSSPPDQPAASGH